MDEERLQQLLDEMIDSDRSAEEVCAEFPELLPQVRQRFRQMRLLDDQLNGLFPTPADDPAATIAYPWHANAELPRIPGYEMLAVLGYGGMGVVYKARHLRLNRTVALKMLLAGAYAGPHELARFQREAEAVAGLRHAGIVQIYDVGDHEGRAYFTMEFVEGGSLAQALAGKPRPAGQAAALVATLAAAVQVAHDGGILHRDLKPANVLLTADGIPKINDFGLARRLEGEAGATLSGVPLGTPSYMAPEQARGDAHAMGPAADVYALGAILYELLTGRPPFHAESAAETVLQVLYHEPVPPSRLNPRVPRDLETICLKCLEKDPAGRYATAAALADDLRRLEEGRPIKARPLSWVERSWRWCRRKPAAAALIATALVSVGLALAGARSLELRQAEHREETARHEGRASQAVEARLEQAATLAKQGRWPEARAALEVDPVVLESPAQASLRERLHQARADADMVAELEEIRLGLWEAAKTREIGAGSGDQLYAAAFGKYRITVQDPAGSVARIRDSAIRETLLAFLHDWLLFWMPTAERPKLEAIVERADDDEWRRRLRKTFGPVYDRAKRVELLLAPEAPAQPPVVIAGLAGILFHGPQEDEARALLRASQRLHPEDFWINLQLGYFLQQDHPLEAVGYFRAAVAGRPNNSQALTLLGRALCDIGDADGAIVAFRKAITLDPNRRGPRDLAKVLAPRGGLEEICGVWEKILEDNPRDFDTWYGYAQLCAFLGNKEAYLRTCKALVERFGDSNLHWTVAERISLTCLLFPVSGDELQRAVALVDQAEAQGPKFPDPANAFILFIKGLAEYRQGRHEKAIPLLQESAALLPNRPGPRLVLAMAQFQSGSKNESVKTLARAIRSYNWKPSQADHPTAWVSHVLGREAETLILPNLPAFIRDSYQPQNNDERFALLGICQCQGRYAAAAQLYADAFAAGPSLADSLTTECRFRTLAEERPDDDRMDPLETECRYLAARCAALVGSGQGKDAAKLSETERTRWRKQARAWLQADLTLWAKTLNTGSKMDRDLTKKILTLWQIEPDLAGLRDLNALDEFSAEEREECYRLWQEVGVVLQRIAKQERAPALDPANDTGFLAVLRNNQIRSGHLEEAREAWKTALETEPLNHNCWFGYAELCLFLGHQDEYRRARQDLLTRYGDTVVNTFVAERTGRACLLLPATGDELRQAVSLTERAVADNHSDFAWARNWFLFAHGLAQYRQGQFDQCISTMQGNASQIGPGPGLVLAMALHRIGKTAEARKALANTILSYDWREQRARTHDEWIPHVLRREAESMILPNLAAFLDGKYQPQDNDERLALLGVCQFNNRTCACANLYVDAFSAAPSLAGNLAAGHRYNAARAAALAGCGRGHDADKLNEAERTRWRRQAREWLKADLTLWTKMVATAAGSGTTPDLAKKMLTQWQREPDLAGLREPNALDKLPADERKECIALWQSVADLLERAQAPAAKNNFAGHES
jgi:serine/threonine-protein kinase